MDKLQALAEKRVLEYKLNRIRDYATQELENAKNGQQMPANTLLTVILNIIQAYELVPADWQLTTPFVDANLYEQALKGAVTNNVQ